MYIAATGSVVSSAIEAGLAVAGGAGSGAMPLIVQAAEGIDGLLHLGAAQAAKALEEDRPVDEKIETVLRTRGFRRGVMSVICTGAVLTGAYSAYELSEGENEPVTLPAIIVSAGGVAVNALASRRLHQHATHGSPHADSFRHTIGDIISGGGMTASLAYSYVTGVGWLPAVSAVIGSGVVFAFNYPTEKRVNGDLPTVEDLRLAYENEQTVA